MEPLQVLYQAMMIDDPLVLANFITDKAVDLELSEEACDKAVAIAADLELYPYKGEESSEKYNFEHDGLMCKVKRNHFFVWCGYVEFTHKDEIENVNVHGGITYDDGYMIGFDCAHWRDITPMNFIHKTKMLESIGFIIENGDEETYKDYNYIVEETRKLAEQLAAL